MADIAKLKTLLASPHPVSGAWADSDAAAAAQGNVVDMEENIDSLSGDQLFTATDAGGGGVYGIAHREKQGRALQRV